MMKRNFLNLVFHKQVSSAEHADNTSSFLVRLCFSFDAKEVKKFNGRATKCCTAIFLMLIQTAI